MTAALITNELCARLLANGALSAAGEDIDPRPVVKLFTPDARKYRCDACDHDTVYGDEEVALMGMMK
ncbi:hypothetical protein GGD83_003656 [Rhodoblastus sphagnicola]|nr:hypothetical protein [Rhodoblastus sphagnicola]